MIIKYFTNIKEFEMEVLLKEKINKKTIIALGWVSFFMDVSSEMIYPLLPVFMASVLGVGGLTIGFVAGLSESVASFFRIFSGTISDRLKRRKALVASGYSLSTVSRVLLALANSWQSVLWFRLVDRAGKGLRTPPRDALISEASTEETYGRYYGYHRAMDTAGAVLGPVLAYSVLATGFATRDVFWLSLIPAIIAVLVLLIFVREKKKTAEEITRLKEVVRGKIPREAKLFLVITAIFSLGNSSNFFLILKANDLGVAEAWIPILYMTMNITYAAVAYPAGRVADRLGKGKVTFIGYFLYSVAYGLFAVAGNAGILWAYFPFYGVYLGITDGVNRAYMATLLPENRRATGFALYHTVIGASLLPASTLAGWLWERYSPSATFVTGATLSLLAGILFGALLLGRSKPAFNK